MDILSMLQKLDKNQLDMAVRKAQEYSRTEEGKKVVEKIKKGESINGFSFNEETQSKIMKELEKKPEVLKKLNDLLGKKGD